MKAALLIALLGSGYLFSLEEPGLIDYDEACYAEVSRGMLERGDFMEPRLEGRPFFEKPPFLYWTQMAGFSLLGVGARGARFFNALAAIGALAGVYLLSRRPLGPRAALLSTLVLGTSAQFMVLARIALMDMWLTLWLLLSMGFLHRAFEAARAGSGGSGAFLAAAAFAGLALLTKGLVGLVLPAAAALIFVALRREWRVLRWQWLLPGATIALAVGGSWYVLLGWISPAGFSYLRELFLEQHVKRFARPSSGHGGPFYYYLIALTAGLLPWSPFLLLALPGTRPARGPGEEARRFLDLMLVFAAVTFLLFSAASTKLPGYITPALPPLAILIGSLVGRPDVHGSRAWRASAGLAALACFITGAACLVAVRIVRELPELLGEKALARPGLLEPFSAGVAPYLCAGCAFACGSAIVLQLRGSRPLAVPWTLGAGSVAILVLASVLVLPAFDAHFQAPLRELSVLAAREAGPERDIVLLGIKHAPSVAFHARHPTRYVDLRYAESVQALHRGPHPEVGITVEPWLDLLERSGEVTVLARRGGYAVFRCAPGSGGR